MKKNKNTNFEHEALFRFYEELNDFLPREKVKKSFQRKFNGNPAIKDPIEAIGVPHTEVDLIIVNGYSVGFDYKLNDGDQVSVYPVFESIDISPIVKLRDEPLRKTSFILDVHLGRLAKMLRMLGFDTFYRNDYDDPEIIQQGIKENRIILTRDRLMLNIKEVTHGYCIRSTDPETQLKEVIKRFDLKSGIKPFYRCTICNSLINEVEKRDILDRLELKTQLYFNEFYRCDGCDRIYWKGSHYDKLKKLLEKIQNEFCL